MTKAHTSDCDLANINPFRYREYVYDSETGLYYLKSRYYDPVTGRFLNADMYCDTQSNIFGTNMFAYCNNNPVNQVDPEGTDAIWLQDVDSVYGFGHTSLMIQDDLNLWWFTYWGDKYIAAFQYGHGNINEFNCLFNHCFDPRQFHNYYFYPYYEGNFEFMLYLKGDYRKSLRFFIDYINDSGFKRDKINPYSYVYGYSTYENKYYNLFFKNCVQASIDALILGTYYNNFFLDTEFKKRLLALRSDVIPNQIFGKLIILYPITLFANF